MIRDEEMEYDLINNSTTINSHQRKEEQENVVKILFKVPSNKNSNLALIYPKSTSFSKLLYIIIGTILFIYLYLTVQNYMLLISPTLMFLLGIKLFYPNKYTYSLKNENLKQNMTFYQLKKSILQYETELKTKFLKTTNKKNRILLLIDPNNVQLVPLTFSLVKTGQELLVLNPNEFGFDIFFNYLKILEVDAIVVSPLLYVAIQLVHYYKKREWIDLGKKKVLFFTSNEGLFRLFRQDHKAWFRINVVEEVFPILENSSEFKEDEIGEFYSYGEDETVAIVNTTGTTNSTGTPKLVHITYSMLKNQIDSFSEMMAPYLLKGRQDKIINHNIVMTLCVNCMGITSIVPPFDLKKPSSVVPTEYLEAINTFYPRFGFCSPIVWIELIEHCYRKNKSLEKKSDHVLEPPLEVLLCGGSIAPFSLHRKLKKWACKDEDNIALFPTYGATECLPICLTNSFEISQLYQTEEDFYNVKRGVCVGKECPNVKVIIRNSEKVSGNCGFGEIWIGGKAVSPRYELNEEAMKETKETINNVLYHKTGDIGYKDDEQRVWYCGRLGHLFHLKTEKETIVVPPVGIEHVFYTEFELIKRCACVGYRPITSNKLNETQFKQQYTELEFSGIAIVFETFGKEKISDQELQSFWREKVLPNNPEYTNVPIKFIQKDELPTDRRHNSKIEMIQIALMINKELL
ncbi:hypothetical protein ABK040_002013 [Willaertia magna]